MKYHRKLAIAVRNGQLCAVYFVQQEIVDWRRTRTRRHSSEQLKAYLHKMMQEYRPDVVVSEALATASRKGKRTRDVLASIGEECARRRQQHLSVQRAQRHQNKHDEALALCERHPALKRVLPATRRRVQDDEPRSYVFFEAVSLAEEASRQLSC